MTDEPMAFPTHDGHPGTDPRSQILTGSMTAPSGKAQTMSDVNKLDELQALLAKLPNAPLKVADLGDSYGINIADFDATIGETMDKDVADALVAAPNWCRDEGITLARQSAELDARVDELEVEIERLRGCLHKIDIIASNTIPRDGKDAAFGALDDILRELHPFRRSALNQKGPDHE